MDNVWHWTHNPKSAGSNPALATWEATVRSERARGLAGSESEVARTGSCGRSSSVSYRQSKGARDSLPLSIWLDTVGSWLYVAVGSAAAVPSW